MTVAPTADDRELHHQLSALQHRGPDSCGYFQSKHAAIGTTRLAVIDIRGGDPPVVNESAHVVAALNGEIYNYRELRRKLAASGHRFRSNTDTEVLAHLCEDFEPTELATRLEGMFACALWDDRTQRLILIRDRAGKKPLYYWHDRNTLVFGSEVKAVLAHPSVPRRMNTEMIADYLVLGYFPSPNTSFEGIVSLPPAHVLVLDPETSVRVERYWSPPASSRSTGRQNPVERARELLTNAVERRLKSDVPLGAFLSGGLDSSSVVAIAARFMQGPLQTFTIGFDDVHGFDERPYARLVAQKFKTQHHEIVVKPNAVDLIEKLVWHYDGPFGDSSAIPTFLLSEATSGTVKVALSGDGGDEIFSGYTRFIAAHYSRSLLHVPPRLRALLRHSIKVVPATTKLGGHSRRFMSSFDMGLPRAFMEWVSYTKPGERAALLRSEHLLLEQIARYEHVWRTTSSEEGILDRLLRLNFSTYLPDDLLIKIDRMSMAHGLEVRSPFLDRELVEWAFSLPARNHVRLGRGKQLLRRAMWDVLPAEILGRKKKGFGVPLDRWFRDDLRTYLQHHLVAPKAEVKRILNPTAVDAAVNSHLANQADNGHLLWALLTLEVFLRSET